MIVEIRINNCYIFNQEVVFSMNADMRNKRFITNVHKENNFNMTFEFEEVIFQDVLSEDNYTPFIFAIRMEA